MGAGQGAGGVATACGQAVLKAAMISNFGAESPQLVKFGLRPKKSRTPSPPSQLAVYGEGDGHPALRGNEGLQATKSGPMVFVDPVLSAEQASTTAVTGVASTAPPVPAPSTAVVGK